MKHGKITRVPKEMFELADKRSKKFGIKRTEAMRDIVAINNELGRTLKVDLEEVPVVKTKHGRKPLFPNRNLWVFK